MCVQGWGLGISLRGWQDLELSRIHGITESSKKYWNVSRIGLVIQMVPSLVHRVNKTRKHWHCRIFWTAFRIPIYPLQRGFYPPKWEYTALQWGYKNKRTEQIYPQFQNAVGILILTAVLSLNFQASQNRDKSLYIQAHKIPLQSDVPVYKMSALVPSRVPTYQTECVPVETFKNCYMFGMSTKMKTACTVQLR